MLNNKLYSLLCVFGFGSLYPLFLAVFTRNISGTFDSVSPSCGGGGRISAEATDTEAIIVAAMAPNAAVDIQTVAAADLVTQQL